MVKKQKLIISVATATALVGSQVGILSGIDTTVSNVKLLTQYGNIKKAKIYNKNQTEMSNSKQVNKDNVSQTNIDNENQTKQLEVNKTVEKSNTKLVETTSTSNIDYNKDLQITPGTVTYSGANTSSTITDYQPMSTQPDSNDILAQGSTLTVNVPFTLKSLGGYQYNVQKVYLTADPTGYYINNSDNAEDTTMDPVESSSVPSLTVLELGQEANMTSSSTGVLTAKFEDDYNGWKQMNELNLKLNVELEDGTVIQVPVSTEQVKTTAFNNLEVEPSVGTFTANGNSFTTNLTLKGFIATDKSDASANSGNFNLGDSDYTIEYKLSNSSSDTKITIPTESGISYDQTTGILTVNSSVFQDGDASIPVTVEYTGNTATTNTFTVTPINYTTARIINSSYNNSVKYIPSSNTFSYTPSGNMLINTVVNQDNSGNYYVSNSIKGALPINADIYSIGVVSDNSLLALQEYNGNANQYNIDPNADYCDIPFSVQPYGNDLSQMQSAEIISEIESAKVYTGEQLLLMAQAGEPLPKVNCLFNKQSISKGTTSYTNKLTNMMEYLTSSTATKGAYCGGLIIVPTTDNTSADLNSFAQYLNQYKGAGDTVNTNSSGELTSFVQTYYPGGYDQAVIEQGEDGQIFPYTSYGSSNNGSISSMGANSSDNQSYIELGSNGSSDESETVAWAQQVHQYTINSPFNEDNYDYVYWPAGTKFTQDMGASFTVTSTPELQIMSASGQTTEVPLEYSCSGGVITFTLPAETAIYGSNIINIIFNGKYNVFSPQTINISSTTDGSAYMDRINNQYIAQSTIEIVDNQGEDNSQLVLTGEGTNTALNSSSNLNSTNTLASFTDTVYNDTTTEQQFMVYGSVPTNELGIPEGDNFIDSSGMESTLNSISASGGKVYLLTSNEVNTLSKQMLTDYNKADTTEYENNIKSTWTAYDGTVPSNTIGYVVFTSIGSKDNYTLNYSANFSGVTSSSNIYSAFGYTNLTTGDNVDSNIVRVLPSEYNNLPELGIRVLSTDGSTLPTSLTNLDVYDILNKNTTSPLYNTMESINNNYIEQQGYSIVSSSLNGVSTPIGTLLTDYEDYSATNSNSSLNNSQNIYTVYVKKNPIYNISTEVVTTTGDVLVPSKVVATGGEGKTETITAPTIPAGYELVKMEMGGNTITSVPTAIGNSNEVVEYVVEPIPKTNITVSAVCGDTVVDAPTTTTDYEGAAYKEVEPTWNTGEYTLDYITLNGEKITANELPTSYGSSNDNIVYVLQKRTSNIDVKTVYPNGDVVANSEKTLTGDVGDAVTGDQAVVPAGYEVSSITLTNETTGTAETITAAQANELTYNTDNEEITFNLTKIPTGSIGIEVVSTTGTVIDKLTTTTGEVGEKVTVPTLPTGYKVVSITCNGKPVSAISNTITDGNYVYIVTVEPQTTVNVSMVNSAGETVGTPITKEGYNSQALTGISETIPTGYHLVNITENGNIITSLPTEFTNSNMDIVYHIAKNIEEGSIVSQVVNSSGQAISQSITVSGDVGEKEALKIPSYNNTEYKIVKILVNGQQVQSVPTEITAGVTKVTYVAEKIIVTDTVKVVNEAGEVIGNIVSYTGTPGATATILEPTIPTGYEIVGLTVNGVKTNTLPTTFGPSNDNIIFTVAQTTPVAQTGTVNIEVVNQKGTVLENTTKIGDVGTKVQAATIPSGYKLVSVSATVNGTKVKNIPTEIEKGTTSIIYTVEKLTDPTDTIPTDSNPTNNDPNDQNVGKVINSIPANKVTGINPTNKTTIKTNPIVTHNVIPTVSTPPTVPSINDGASSTNINSNTVENKTSKLGDSSSTNNGENTVKYKGLPDTGLPVGEDMGMGAEVLLGLGAFLSAIIGAFKIKRRKDKGNK